MLNTDISYHGNSVDPDQLASSEKPADQDPHCFTLFLYKHANLCKPAMLLDRHWGRMLNIKISSMRRTKLNPIYTMGK